MVDKVDYSDMLNQLREGKIDKLLVKPEDFMDFQKAFIDFDYRKRVVGTAKEGGTITYVYENDNN